MFFYVWKESSFAKLGFSGNLREKEVVEMIKQSKISVRHLVEFILRRGSIDNRKKSNHTALEGARIHRKLQKDAGENYEKEVF